MTASPKPIDRTGAARRICNRWLRMRLVGSGFGALALGAALLQAGVPFPHMAWLLLGLHAIGWPVVAWNLSMQVRGRPVLGERRNVLADALLGAAWLPAIGFNLFPSAMLLSMLCMSAAALGGVRDLLRAALCCTAGVALGAVMLASPLTLTPDLRTCLACVPMLLFNPLMLGAASYQLSLRLHGRRKEVEQAAQRHRQTLDALDAGIVLYDENDRLLVANQAFRDLYPLVDDVLDRHPTFEELLRAAVARGVVPAAVPGSAEQWIAERLRQHRQPASVIHRRQLDGSWRRIVERRLPNGGSIGFSIDITEVEEANAQRDASAEQLRLANAQLEVLSSTDELTGLANRRCFDQRFQAEWRRCRLQHRPLALVFIDIDYFKRFNDTYGHLAGDDCLRALGSVLRQCVRRGADLAARYGGEEFVLLLPDIEAPGAIALTERCLEAVRALKIPHAGSPAGTVTASAGVAMAQHGGAQEEGAMLMRAADAALYAAKALGRGRLQVADTSLARGLRASD